MSHDTGRLSFDSLRGPCAIPHAKRGNVIVTFALTTIPMVGFVGAAVDYSRGNSAKAAMQQAIDATGADPVEGCAVADGGALKERADQLSRR